MDIADTRTAVVEAVASADEAAAFVVGSHKELAPDIPNSRCPFALQLRNLSPLAMVAGPERFGRILHSFRFVGYAKPKILVEQGLRSSQAFLHIKGINAFFVTKKNGNNVTM